MVQGGGISINKEKVTAGGYKWGEADNANT